jgi:ubiquinol-cytochrome c reductase cytochrome b subunit
MKPFLRGHVGRWLYDRLALEPIVKMLLEHKVPPQLAGKKGWFYVFGFATLTAFVVQVVTGMALTTYYVPSPAHAHESLREITEETTFGPFLRGMHFYGASAMVVLVLVHMARVFLTGAYKFPREMSWISGAVLLALTTAMALTGQLLRFDQNGYWTVVVAAYFFSRVPVVGSHLADFLIGGPTVGGATLTRFFALHVFIFPAMIVALIALHLYLVMRNGVSEPPVAGQKVDPRTYREKYKLLKEQHGVPYFPLSAARDAIAATVVVGIVVLLAFVLGPKGPAAPPDPTVASDPRPDWFVRWYYALLWAKPAQVESLVMVYAPLLVFAALVALPILSPAGERAPSRRPLSVLLVVVTVVAAFVLTVIGIQVPWQASGPKEALGPAELGVDAGPVLAGARVYHAMGCPTCHVTLDRGGHYGPDLTRVAARLSRQEITARIVMGLGDMPAYRDALDEDELSALLAFLEALPSREARGRQ